MAPRTRHQNYWTQPCNTPGPGPGAYKMHSTVGYDNHDTTRTRYPSYSLAKRLEPLYEPPTPGPIYSVSGLNRYGKKSCDPGYTIAPRLAPLKQAVTPGPGEYAPEQHPHPSKRTAPAFSLSPRTAREPRFKTPGPNQYGLPTTIGRSIPNMKCSPTVYLAGRLDQEIEMTSPGPAGYGVPKYSAFMYESPKVYINSRLKQKEIYRSPGPQAYFPTYNTGPNAPAYTMRALVGRCITPLITAEDLCD